MEKAKKYDKKKFVQDLASTPLLFVGCGKLEFKASNYIIEEIEVKNIYK